MHAGHLKTKCGSCSSHGQDVRDALGCNPLMSANAPAWQLIDGERVTSFMNCPSLFIPETVYNFARANAGYQRQRFSLPSESAQPSKFIRMSEIYDSWKAHFEVEKMHDDQRQAQIQTASKYRIA